MKKVWLAANPSKIKALKVVKNLQRFLQKKNFKVFTGTKLKEKLTPEDLIVALGGDGTLLRVARIVAKYNVPVLGVNVGGLGFLTEVPVTELYKTLDKVLKGQVTLEERMMLKAKIFRKNKEIGTYIALNDVVINNGKEARVINLGLKIDNKDVANCIADGLIVATPTGSTAYALAAGGPIVYPDVEVIIVVPICPHTLTLRPLIVSAEKEINITIKTNHHEAILTLDGQIGVPLNIGDVIIVKKAEETLRLITNPYKNYFQLLRTKLKWSERA